MTAHVAEPTHDNVTAGSITWNYVPCAICGNHVGAEGHAWRDGLVCPDCCPRCGLVDMLAVGPKADADYIALDEIGILIADGALTDDEVADVMGVEG